MAQHKELDVREVNGPAATDQQPQQRDERAVDEGHEHPAILSRANTIPIRARSAFWHPSRFLCAVAHQVADELRVTDEDGASLGLRLIFELHQQRLDRAKPVVAVVYRSRLPGRCRGVGLRRVAGRVCALLAKDIDEDVDLAGIEVNSEVVRCAQPDHLHDVPFRERLAPRRLVRDVALR